MADFLFQVDGFCPVCELPATFAAKDPWLRDHFLCQTCNAQPRERALFAVLGALWAVGRAARIDPARALLGSLGIGRNHLADRAS